MVMVVGSPSFESMATASKNITSHQVILNGRGFKEVPISEVRWAFSVKDKLSPAS